MMRSLALAASTRNRDARVTNRMDWQSVSERELVERTRADEREAFGELVRRHQTAVFNAAYRIVGERQTALDLAQDAFVRAYQALASFDAARPFAPWVRRIAVNLALNWLEGNRAQTVPIDRDDESELPLPDVSSEPERAYLRAEQSARVRQAILKLPPRQRAIIELRHFQDYAYDEIALALDLPLSDVKSDLFRARQKLREILGEA
jgi:RNA polymerase sigma-70 factor, ECF subfamily